MMRCLRVNLMRMSMVLTESQAVQTMKSDNNQASTMFDILSTSFLLHQDFKGFIAGD